MQRLLLYISLTILISACTPDPVDPIPEVPQNCTVEFEVYYCPMYFCPTKEAMAGVEVELYLSWVDMDNGQLFMSEMTNQNGWVKFYDLDCGKELFMKIDLGEFGVYTNQQIFFGTNLEIEVPLRKNQIYDNFPYSEPIVDHVSLEYPTFPQYSVYRYFEKTNSLNFDAVGHYVNGVELQVQIGNQLDENTFVVSEYFFGNSQLDKTYFDAVGPYQESIWRFENDSIFVSPMPNDDGPFVSFIWNIQSEDEISGQEYAFPINIESSNYLDMNEPYEFPVPAWSGNGLASDYQIGDLLFENLMVDKRNYLDENGPLKYQIYNKKYGVVRTLQFFGDQTERFAGFDLRTF